MVGPKERAVVVAFRTFSIGCSHKFEHRPPFSVRLDPGLIWVVMCDNRNVNKVKSEEYTSTLCTLNHQLTGTILDSGKIVQIRR